MLAGGATWHHLPFRSHTCYWQSLLRDGCHRLVSLPWYQKVAWCVFNYNYILHIWRGWKENWEYCNKVGPLLPTVYLLMNRLTTKYEKKNWWKTCIPYWRPRIPSTDGYGRLDFFLVTPRLHQLSQGFSCAASNLFNLERWHQELPQKLFSDKLAYFSR